MTLKNFSLTGTENAHVNCHCFYARGGGKIAFLKEMKNQKSPGQNDITEKMKKIGGKGLHKQMYNLIINIWEEE